MSTGDRVLRLSGVEVRFEGRRVLGPLDWSVRRGEHWVVLGPNGSGKSTLIGLAAVSLHPSAGTVEVLGQRLGAVDIRPLRRRIGRAGSSLAAQLRPSLAAEDVVVTAARGALEPWWHEYSRDERDEARALLDRFGLRGRYAQPLATFSSGEQQRVLLARALMTDPELVLLDEPAAALDLGAREDLVARLGDLTRSPSAVPMVLVTHHVDEIPVGFTHVLLLDEGGAVASGPIDEALTAAHLSQAFGLDLELSRSGDRWSARANR